MDRFLLVVAMFAAPLVTGIVFGLIQAGMYRLLHRPPERIPPFIILFARGLLAAFVLAAAAALAVRLLSR